MLARSSMHSTLLAASLCVSLGFGAGDVGGDKSVEWSIVTSSKGSVPRPRPPGAFEWRNEVATPSIVVYEDTLYVSTDEGHFPDNMCSMKTFMFTRPVNGGPKWEKSGVIQNMYWGSLFVADNDLYILGSTGDYLGLYGRKCQETGFVYGLVVSKLLNKGTNMWSGPVMVYKGNVMKHNLVPARHEVRP